MTEIYLEKLSAFGRMLRAEGLNVGPKDTEDGARLLAAMDLQNREQVKKCLVEGITEGIRFKSKASEKAAAKLLFTERQANAILDMRLYKLIGLEIEALHRWSADRRGSARC